MHPDSTAANQKSKSYAFDAGQRALEAHLQRMEICGRVTTSSDSKRAGFYRVHYEWQSQTKELPLLSIIIPNKDEIASLNQCLTSIAQSSYRNYEVIIVENNSTDTATFGYYEQILQLSEEERRQKKLPEQIRVVTWESKSGFNYSAINNFGVSVAKGEFLVLLNNDIELLSKDWMEEFLGHCMRPEVAIAGARLYYPDNSIQHAGIVVGVGGHARGVASNMFVGTRRIQEGYLHKAAIQMDYSAVTAACMMIKRSVFEEVGGFTEELAVAFNDVDLCLKVRKKGYLVVYDPYVEAYHYESKSRGQEDSEEKVRRFQKEIEYMRTEWNDILRYGDPYYNPHFSRIYSDYRLG
jgi:GT2 family glycosyltransferase